MQSTGAFQALHSHDDTPAPLADLRIALRPRAIMRAVVGLAAVLLLLHLLVVSSYLLEWRFPSRQRFYFDAENNLPTFFSTCILLLASGLLVVISRVKWTLKDRFTTHWALLAVVFFGLAMDEAASLHEVLINPLRSAFHFTGLLWQAWVIAGMAFVAVFAVAYLRFLGSLPARVRLLFLASGALYVTGAVLMEMVGSWLFLQGQAEGRLWPYMVAMTLEESLEIVGVLLFVNTLLAYLQQCCRQVSLRVDSGTR